MSLREKGKSRRRQRIIDAAIDLIIEEGSAALSTAKLASRAEVSTPTLYNLIGSMDEILGHVINTIFEEFVDSLELDLHGPMIERADTVMDSLSFFLNRSSVRNQRVLALIIGQVANYEVSIESGSALEHLDNWFLGATETLLAEQTISEDVDTHEFSQALMMAALVVVQNWVFQRVDPAALPYKLRYSIYSLIGGWATPQAKAVVESRLKEAQQQLVALRPAQAQSSNVETTSHAAAG